MKARFRIDAWAVSELGKWEEKVCILVDAMPRLYPAGRGEPGCHLCRQCETFDSRNDDRDEFRKRRPGALYPEISCEGCVWSCLENAR